MKEITTQKPKPFKQLPKRHREFIREYVRSGDLKGAYRAVGYKVTDRVVAAKARQLALKLSPYIDEQMHDYIKSTEMGVFGIARLRDLAENAESEQVQLNAAKELLARNMPEGPKVVEHKHSHESMSTEELKAEINKIMGNMALPIDGVASLVHEE